MVMKYSSWVEQAEYEIETARSLVESGRYLYVLFLCQQSVEKMLKALYIKEIDEMPPRIHNLVRLSEYVSLQLSPEQLSFIAKLSSLLS